MLRFSTKDGKVAAAGCPFNTGQYPPGSTPLKDIYEEYADDQDAWIRDFVPTLVKMLANGYDQSELRAAPDQWSGIHCTRENFFVCFKEKTISKSFYIVSNLDGKVLEHMNSRGDLFLTSKVEGKQKQLWYWAGMKEEHDTLINFETKMVLSIWGNHRFNFIPDKETSW